MQIISKIANLLIGFNVEKPLSINAGAERFRGFAIDTTEKVDYQINIVKVNNNDKILSEENLFSADNSSMQIGFKWSISSIDNDCDCITVDYDNNKSLIWAQLIMHREYAEMRLCLKDEKLSNIDPFVYPIFNIMLSRIANERGMTLIHSSLVEYKNQGYLFTATSGTGKSTMARIWRDNYAAKIINDDMILLVPQMDNTIVGYNIPMANYIDVPKTVRLKALNLIAQSKNNYIKQITGAESVMRVMANTIFQSTSKTQIERQLRIVTRICSNVPIFEVGFKPDADIVKLIVNQ